MSQQKDAKKVTATNMKLKKMVDWKIFELQSILVSDDVDDETVNESLLWFQPRHFSEVVEERINDGKCGYPLCSNPLDDQNNASYRINYAEKKIYSIELSSRYCCVACIEKAQLLEKKFDDSLPYSRSIVKTLDLTAPVVSNIDEVLNLLTPHPVAAKSAAIHDGQVNNDLPPPPAYQSSVFSHTGDLNVKFLDGLPVPVKGDTGEPSPHVEHTGAGKQQRPDSADPGVSESRSDSGMEIDRESPDANQGSVFSGAVGSALHREVYHSREAAAQDSAPESAPISADVTAKASAAPLKSTATSSKASTGADVSMAEMFATMNALRVKHNLTNPSTAPTSASTGSSTRFTNGSLIEKTPAPVKKDVMPPSAGATTTVRAGTMGRRPGAKNVRWGANSSTNIDNTATVESMSTAVESLPSKGGSDTVSARQGSTVDAIAPAPTIKNAAAAGVPVVKEKTVAPISGAKRTTMQLSGQVMERVNPRPMSAAAMMRKREDVDAVGGAKMQRHMLGSASSGAILKSPSAASSSSSSHASSAGPAALEGLGTYDRDEMDRGDDEGDQWVDVDPSELLALGYAGPGSSADSNPGLESAMSIEGYIANVKKSIRVSPATTIKNLSHSPYTYQDINHIVKAGNVAHQSHTDSVDVEPMDVSETDAPSDDEDEVATQNSDDVEEMWETDDEGEGTASAEAPEPVLSQSLFLTVWATMDELFGASLDGVFHESTGSAPASTEGPAVERTLTAQLVSDRPSFTEPVEASRPPIALEQQNAQHAFVKLLQRGIQSAESQLNLTSMILTLHEERSAYAVIKHKLLNTANNTLHRRNNLSSSLGASNAGTGLHSAGWTLIGLLVIDAVVTKKQIGPLRRKKQASDSTSTAPAAGALVSRDVSAEAWNNMIERTAVDVLHSATNRKNSNLMKLRDGDLQILRSYFDYI